MGGIHVGGTSNPGTDNLYVDGNTGLGTTSPDAKVDIQTSGTTLLKVQGNGNGYVNAGLWLEANDDNNSRGLGVFMHQR